MSPEPTPRAPAAGTVLTGGTFPSSGNNGDCSDEESSASQVLVAVQNNLARTSEQASDQALSHWEALATGALTELSGQIRWPRELWRVMHKQPQRSLSLRARQVVSQMTTEAWKQDSRRVTKTKSIKSTKFQAIDPQSKTHIMWIFLCIALLLYDVVSIPMQFVGLVTGEVMDLVDAAALVFWTIDMLLQFAIGIYIQGTLERRFRKVARTYMTTWMPFDFLVTVPLWFVHYASTSDDESLKYGQAVRVVKVMRFLRFLKVLRLVKLQRLVGQFLESINSPGLLISLNIAKLMFGMIVFNHIFACWWFGVGEYGWRLAMFGEEEATKSQMYLTCLHWALTQFQGTGYVVPVTVEEHLYAVAFLVFALIVLALFVSSLTNSIRELQELSADRVQTEMAMQSYLKSQSVSAQLSVRIKMYLRWKTQLKSKKVQDEHILSMLPRQMLAEVHWEVRAPLLNLHHFFRVLCTDYPQIVRRISHSALSPLLPAPAEVIFKPGDPCHNMYLVVSGFMAYRIRSAADQEAGGSDGENLRSSGRGSLTLTRKASWIRKSQESPVLHEFRQDSFGSSKTMPGDMKLGAGRFLSEAALWTKWDHCGELVDVEESSGLTLGVQQYVDIVVTHAEVRLISSIYARRFCAAMACEEVEGTVTDLITYTALFGEEARTEWRKAYRKRSPFSSQTLGLGPGHSNSGIGLARVARLGSFEWRR